MNPEPYSHDNPFAQFAENYERARRESQAMSPQARIKDWTRNKSSTTGSASQEKPVIYVSPVSGDSVQI